MYSLIIIIIIITIIITFNNNNVNQISVAPISVDKARLSGATAESLFNSKIEESVPWHQWAIIGCAGV